MGQQESRKAQLEIDGKPQPEMIADPIYQPLSSWVEKTNKSMSDTPVIISALVMGMLLMLMQMLRGRRFMEKNPMAASVPNTVEINAARTATLLSLIHI